MGKRGVVHHFYEDNAYSLDPSDEWFWWESYRLLFPGMTGWLLNSDRQAQLRGVDRVIALKTGHRFYIDEKKRKVDYGDFLLEYVSNDVYQTPGWIAKNLAIDYIAYAIMPTKTVYLIPWSELKFTWLSHSDRWLHWAASGQWGMRLHKAQNEGYCTLNITVPRQMLLTEVSHIRSVTLD